MTLQQPAEESSSSSKDIMPEIVRNDTWEDEEGSEDERENNGAGTNPKTQKAKSDLVQKQKTKPASPRSDLSETTPKQQISAFDSFLKTTVKFASSSALTDKGIKLLAYSLWFLSRLTQHYDKNPELSPGLRKMYSDLNMVRYALRLYGLPVSIEDIRSGNSWKGWKDTRIHFLGKIMAWSIAFYYPLEHVAYGGFITPKLIKADAEKYTAYSCRAWLIYILSDLVSTIFKLGELKKRRHELLKDQGLIGNGDPSGMTEEEAKKKEHDLNIQVKLNRLHIMRCLFFVPPCAHWSYSKWLRDPLLSENVVNGFCLAEAITCFYQSLCSLRK